MEWGAVEASEERFGDVVAISHLWRRSRQFNLCRGHSYDGVCDVAHHGGGKCQRLLALLAHHRSAGHRAGELFEYIGVDQSGEPANRIGRRATFFRPTP